jgi:hypothetical protein
MIVEFGAGSWVPVVLPLSVSYPSVNSIEPGRNPTVQAANCPWINSAGLGLQPLAIPLHSSFPSSDRSQLYVYVDPAQLPRFRPVLIESDSIHTGVAANVVEGEPRLREFPFPALCDKPVLAGTLRQLSIGVFPRRLLLP